MTSAYDAASTSAALTAGSRRTFDATTTSATRRSASFQAAMTSRVLPRTPSSHSCAIATLCSARPTTRTMSARPVIRRALIDDRHQGQAEVDDSDTTREERTKAPSREEADLGREAL